MRLADLKAEETLRKVKAMRKPSAERESEASMAEKLVTWLKDQKWRVYQEVATRSAPSARADIVARRGPLVWIIECKVRFGLDVLGQAFHWRPYAHLVSVAVMPSNHRQTEFLLQVLADYGIGYLTVYGSGSIHEDVRPAFRRRIDERLKNKLRKEHETYAKAGNALSHYFSPFKGTCIDVLAYVQQFPGCTLKQLVENVQTHYASAASAKSALASWIQAGKVPGVRVDRSTHPMRVFPK
jgi:hypothetical protein